MAIQVTPQSRTLRQTFSFYATGSNDDQIREASAYGDALVLGGPSGPKNARAVLGSDWRGPLLFDRQGYLARRPGALPIDPGAWFEAQFTAGADRLLTPGRWIAWSTDPASLVRGVDLETAVADISPGSTVLLAIDYRWLSKEPVFTRQCLQSVDQPVALLIAHRGDPLSATGVLDGLLGLLRAVKHLTLLRCDHGAIGALAFGAAHASIGLQPAQRHLVPPDATGGGKQDDTSPRLFVRDLMDWFTALTISGWGATSARLTCPLTCCDGRDLARFLDPRFEEEAAVHNLTALTELATYILEDDPDAQRRSFATLCYEALANYGTMGKLAGIVEPSDQLVSWAQWASPD